MTPMTPLMAAVLRVVNEQTEPLAGFRSGSVAAHEIADELRGSDVLTPRDRPRRDRISGESHAVANALVALRRRGLVDKAGGDCGAFLSHEWKITGDGRAEAVRRGPER